MTVQPGGAFATLTARRHQQVASRIGFRYARRPVVALGAVFAAVITPYLLAIGGPLRLAPDSVVFLAQARGLPLPHGHQVYPFGYPALLRAIDNLGLGSAWGLVTVNLFLLGVALAVVYRLGRDPFGLSPTKAALVCLAILLSRTVSLIAPSPLSELPYFAVAMICLLALTRAEQRTGRSRLTLLVLGGVLAAAAISIRTQGLALVPPVLFVAIGIPNLRSGWGLARRHRAIALASAAFLVVGLIAATVLVIRTTPYSHQLGYVWRDINGIGQLVARLHDEVRAKLMSVGELAGQTHCCAKLSPSFAPLLEAAGVVVLAFLVLGWRIRPRFGAIEVFVLSTALVVLVYAGGQPRFWLAALPFMIVYLLFAGERLASARVAKVALVVFLGFFGLAGAGWLVESVRISTAGRRFPDLWASQARSLAATYRVAFGEGRPGDQRNINSTALRELRLYEPLARRRPDGAASLR
jgi:hypothetical protein